MSQKLQFRRFPAEKAVYHSYDKGRKAVYRLDVEKIFNIVDDKALIISTKSSKILRGKQSIVGKQKYQKRKNNT